MLKGSFYDIIDGCLIYKNNQLRINEKEYGSKFNDYRHIDVEEKEIFINDKLSILPIHQILKQINLSDVLWNSDTVSLYASDLWDKKTIYPRIETEYAYTKVMTNDLINEFNFQTFLRGSVILRKWVIILKTSSFNIFPFNKKLLELNLLEWEMVILLMFWHLYIFKNLLKWEGKWLKTTKV